MPFLEAGTFPPNWKELIEHSSEMATTEDVFKADAWLSRQKMVDATNQLTDPFVIEPDQHKKQQPQRRVANKSNPITEHVVSRKIVCHTAHHIHTVILQAVLQLTSLISMDAPIFLEQGPLKLAAPTG